MTTETFVPPALRKPGWSRDYRKDENAWSAEREVFSWLFGPFMPPQGRSIEDARRLFEEWIDAPPSLARAGWLSRWLARNDVPCEHGVRGRLFVCAHCKARHQECVQFLNLLKEDVEAYNRSSAFWLSLDPYEFESAVAQLFRDMGLEAERTPGSGDGGVDVFVRRRQLLVAVQCKQYRQPIGPASARELLGAMVVHGAHSGILICTGGFTAGVHEIAADGRILLYDLNDLVELRPATDSGTRAN